MLSCEPGLYPASGVDPPNGRSSHCLAAHKLRHGINPDRVSAAPVAPATMDVASGAASMAASTVDFTDAAEEPPPAEEPQPLDLS